VNGLEFKRLKVLTITAQDTWFVFKAVFNRHYA